MLEVLSQVIGFTLGLASGFYFERRATRSAEASNRALLEQLDHLRETNEHLMRDGRVQQEMLTQLRSILSAVRPPPRRSVNDVALVEGLAEQLHRWIKRNSGPDGRVANGLARAKMSLSNAEPTDVEIALAALVEAGRVDVAGKELRAL